MALVAGTGLVAVVALTLARAQAERGPSVVPSSTAAELRERADLADVLPSHAAAAQELLAALSATASVTWRPNDAAVFAHARDGYTEQVVDGYPAMSWDPSPWRTHEAPELDEAAVEAIVRTFRDVLEPRGYTVSVLTPTTRHAKALSLLAVDAHGSELRLRDRWTTGELVLTARTQVLLLRSDTCDPDPLTCVPAVDVAVPHPTS